MKRKTTIITTAVLLIFILIMIGGCGSDMKKAKYQQLQMQSFSISTGGGMSGARSELSVRLDTTTNVVMVYKSDNHTWFLNPQAELYTVDNALLDEIKQIVIDEKLYKAADAPISKMQVLDAATTTYHFSFAEGEFFSFSTSQEISPKVYDATKKIRTLIEESCIGATAYPTVLPITADEYVPWKEQDMVSVDCANEGASRLVLNIYNGTNENVKLTGAVTFSKMEGDEAVSTETLVENYEMEVYGQGQDYIILNLPFENYPTEGTYKVTYAGYETTFEMKVYSIE